ncbi:S10 family peptidase [Rhodothermus bifroesti]|uniref:Carboxypeptidase n=1 Tax=Rhodothermus marinus TaxID=29549 RepID=A0A7V2B2B8_RHOMR|nr:carboxypeptidase [Rhodothermus bifroesti]
MLRGTTLCLLWILLGSVSTQAQQRRLPVDTAVVTHHTVTIKGVPIPYRAVAGTQPVWDAHGRPIAALFYVYYEREDVQDRSQRPLVFSFNGGPGSSSVWMHIGYTGPRRVRVDAEGFPMQPYGIEENPYSLLDVADLVYVDPLNTGFSRTLSDTVKVQRFFGVNEDVAYLADWIATWVSRHGRWHSPKFLIGESYGTTRVAGLAGALQERHWMYINGVILVSPTGLGIKRDGPVAQALLLPYYTAAAWYHQRLAPELQQRDLEVLLAEVENYAIDVYLPALVRGNALTPEQRQEIAHRVALYAGLSTTEVLQYNLSVPRNVFWKALLRDEGFTIGRLDSRYRGIDRQAAGEQFDHDPALSAWNHAFSPAINDYLRKVLGFQTDLEYWVLRAIRPWNFENDQTGEQLRRAMAQNPYLHVFVQAGYFDGGTDYFSAKYTLWQLDPSGKLSDRLFFKGYRSGHMMYLRLEDLAVANDDLRRFIQQALEAAQQPARY